MPTDTTDKLGDAQNAAGRAAGRGGPGWNARYVAALASHGYSIIPPVPELNSLPGAPPMAPFPQANDEPSFPYPSWVVPTWAVGHPPEHVCWLHVRRENLATSVAHFRMIVQWDDQPAVEEWRRTLRRYEHDLEALDRQIANLHE